MAGGRRLQLSIMGIHYPPPDEVKELKQEEVERSAVMTCMQVAAEYYHRQGTHYFFYEEQMEGYPGAVKSRIKCREGFLELLRQGGMESRMVFEAGKKYRTDYPALYGNIRIDIITDTVTLETGDICPQVTVDYVLENEGRQMGAYRLILQA